MTALTNTVNCSRTSVASVAEPKFVLPNALVTTLVNGGKDEITSTTPPPVPSTVAPKIQGDAAAVSNADFIAAIFGTMPEGASALVCSKPGDPNTGSWAAKPATQVETACSAHLNNYFNCASVHADTDGVFKAKKENAESYRCLVLDDVGTKADRTLLGDFKASWVLETSPGNFQVGYILAQPLTNAAEVTELQNLVKAAELCDPAATGMTRWMRLPNGINGKEKYRSADGQPFQCVLKKWRPTLRYNVDEIIAGLKLDIAPANAPAQSAAKAVTTAPARTIDPADVAKLPALLAAIDPDCGRNDWVRALMAVYHTTGGSDEGFALANDWSSKGNKYPGTKALEVQWKSFTGNVQRPVTIGTLIKMARDAGADVTAITQHRPKTFERGHAGEIQAHAATAASMELAALFALQTH